MRREMTVDLDAVAITLGLYCLWRIMANTDRIANQTGEIRREVAPREWEQIDEDDETAE